MTRYTLLLTTALMILPTLAPATDLGPIETLGKDIFFDEALSQPPGQSCATCHGPEAGFAGPDSEINRDFAAYPGAVETRFSNRKPPTATYAGDSPVLNYVLDADADEYLFIGGMFFDGRAHGWLLQDPLAEQAQGPFLNPLEQNLPDMDTAVRLIESIYGDRFEALGLPLDVTKSQAAYDTIAKVIAAYERSFELQPFDSKYDQYLAGKVELTEQELWGLKLFEGAALCSECHPSQPGPNGEPPLFTDFSYDNLGVPRNPKLLFYDMPADINPDGEDYIDPGLGGFLATTPQWAHMADDYHGVHKVPTLRNIDKRPSEDFVKVYMHNGVFSTLEEVVNFYNTRDVGDWPEPEIAETVNKEELGDLKLTAAQEAAVVAFMKTLSDGYQAGQE